MFEVIICRVKTGKVERKLFETREEAGAYLALQEAKLLTPRPNQKRLPSLRDFRLEVRPVEAVVVRPLVVRGLAA
jgi:hypothetical protein